MLIFRLTIGVIIQVVTFSAFLFLPAWTVHWWRAWVFLGAVWVASAATLLALYPRSRDLLVERLKSPIQKGQPLADRVVLLLFVVEFYALLVLIPLDVFRFHLLPHPNLIVSSLGLLLAAAGWIIIYLTFRDNAFATAVVRHQEERNHIVIDTGVYAIVRHPMYFGGVLLLLGIPLWLESYAAALFAILPILTLALRLTIEERFLIHKLEGYDAYLKKVRYRLIPFIW